MKNIALVGKCTYRNFIIGKLLSNRLKMYHLNMEEETRKMLRISQHQLNHLEPTTLVKYKTLIEQFRQTDTIGTLLYMDEYISKGRQIVFDNITPNEKKWLRKKNTIIISIDDPSEVSDVHVSFDPEKDSLETKVSEIESKLNGKLINDVFLL